MNILQFLKLKTDGLRATPVTVTDPLPTQRTPPSTMWRYTSGAGGYTNSASNLTAKAADTGLSQYVTGVQLSASTLANASEFIVGWGSGAANVLLRVYLPAAGFAPVSLNFDPPLKAPVGEVIRIQAVTLFATGAVFVNIQGYTAL